jgi:hypothetical protein
MHTSLPVDSVTVIVGALSGPQTRLSFTSTANFPEQEYSAKLLRFSSSITNEDTDGIIS